MRTFPFFLLAAVSACSPRSDPAGPAPEPVPGAVAADASGLSCSGTPASRGFALRKAVEGASDGSSIVLGPCEYLVSESLRIGYDYRDSIYNSGIRIEGVTGLSITGAGQGRTTVTIARAAYFGFEIRSNTTGLTISDMTIAGSISGPLCQGSPESPPCYGSRYSPRPNTHAVGSPGRTVGVRDITLRNLEVRNVAVGLSVGGGRGGYAGAIVADNYVHDIYGTYSGSGYGIHVGCGSGVTIRDNVIARTGRHAIYVGCTPIPNPEPIVVVGNTIVDHGHGELMSVQVAALTVARSDNVAVIDNMIVGSHAHGISAEFDPATGRDCTRCLIAGNEFINRDAPEDIWINSRAPVWTWANVREGNRPARIKSDSRSDRDVAGAGMFWSGTQAITTMDADLYVMQNDVLYAVASDYGISPESGWRERRSSTSTWPDFVGMTASDGRVWVWQGDAVHAVTPAGSDGPWAYTSSSGWSGPGSMASSPDGQAFILQRGAITRVSPSSWAYGLGDAEGDGSSGLGWGERWLFAQDARRVYELEIGAGSSPGRMRVID